MGKPTAIIGAGGGTGTARAQMQLLQTLGETGSVVMVKPGVQINSCAAQTFDSEGNLIDDNTRELLRRHLDAFTQWIQLVRPG